MATNFPNSPAVNDTFTSGGKVYIWDGEVWRSQSVVGGAGVTADSLRPFIGRNAFVDEPTAPHSMDDEFLTTLNTSTKWTVETAFSSLLANAAITSRGLRFTGNCMLTQPISGSSWTLLTRFQQSSLPVDTCLGLVFWRGTTFVNLGYYSANSYVEGFYSASWNGATSAWIGTTAAAVGARTWIPNFAALHYFRYTLSAGTISYQASVDGAEDTFRTIGSFNTSVIGGDPEKVGIWHINTHPGIVEFFRRTT